MSVETEIEELFHQAIGLSTDVRNDFIKNLRPTLSKELNELLQAHSKSQNFLETSPAFDFHPFEVGTQVENYKILDIIGIGSFATVYRAWDETLNREVALKVSADLGGEGVVMAQLDHPHIVPVYSQSKNASLGVRILCMKFIEGSTLSEFLASKKWAAIEDKEGWILKMGQDLCSALEFAHSLKILHLDIKPENILVSVDGEVLLTDFNVALSERHENSIRGGTPEYMAPEHQGWVTGGASQNIDGRTDVFSLGKVLQKLLSKTKRADLIQLLETAVCNDKQTRISSAADFKQKIIDLIELREKQSQVPSGKWLQLAAHYPLTCLWLAILVPQVVSALVNIIYNSIYIVELLTPLHRQVFQKWVLIYNIAAYGLIIPMGVLYLIPVTQLKSVSQARNRALCSPFGVSLLISLGWLPCAFVFPLVLESVGGGIGVSQWVHFVMSVLISWLIAVAYSYAFIKAVIWLLFLPKLWWLESTQSIRALAHRNERALPWQNILLILIPLVGVALLLGFAWPENASLLTSFRFLLLSLLGVALMGAAFAVGLFRVLQSAFSVWSK